MSYLNRFLFGAAPQQYALRLAFAACALLAMWPQALSAHQPHDPIGVVAVSPNYATDQTIFVATSAITMPLPVSEFVPLKSTNGGFTFSVLPGLPNQPMHSIAISPGYATDGTVFMAGAGGLWRSIDSGASWIGAGAPALASGVGAVALTANFTTSGVAFAMTARNIYKSSDHGQTWLALPAPSPLASNLSAVGVSPNYAVDSTLMLGTVSSGIYLSTNGGQTWTLSTSGTLPQINALTFSTGYATDKTVFAATHGSGILLTKNGGSSWAASNSGLTDLWVTAIALSPGFATDNLMWVSTATAGVFQSHGRGAAWTVTGTVPRPLSPQTNDHYTTLAAGTGASAPALFVGMFEGLWSSTNGGANWTYCETLPTRLVRAMSLSPNYPQDKTVFVSTYGGGTLWTTTGGLPPGGWSFRNTQLQDSYTDATAMAPNYSTSGTSWIGTTAGLDRLTGTSVDWQAMKGCGAETFPRSLGVSSGFATDNIIFIGTHAGAAYPPKVTCGPPPGVVVPNRGLFVSLNAGQNWNATGIQGDAIDSIGMSPNYPVDHTLFAGSSLSGLFKSVDSGATFTPITIVPGDNGTVPVTCSPGYATDQTVFAGTSHSGIFKSTDGGASWTQLPGTGVLTAFSFALSPNYVSDQTLFIGTLQQGLMKSIDGGHTLTHVAAIPGAFVSAVAVSSGFATDKTVWAASYLGIYKSLDGGTTWSYVGEPSRQEEQRQFGSGAFYSIVYTGSWNIKSDLAASTIQLATTSQSGATATLSFLGSGIRWVGMTSPTGGTAQVTVDGVVDQTVNLQSATTVEQQSLWLKTGMTCAPHTVTITATPATGLSVNLDAFDVWQTGCPQVAPINPK